VGQLFEFTSKLTEAFHREQRILVAQTEPGVTQDALSTIHLVKDRHQIAFRLSHRPKSVARRRT